jgi:serine/threonine protein kinase
VTTPETTFGKYRLLRALPSSKLVETHQAALAGPGGFERTCVLKKLTPAGVKAGLTEAFADRARVAAELNHPNIARAFDFGKVGDDYYVAVDFTEGLALDVLLAMARERRRPPGPELAVHLGLRLCDALAYAEAAPAVLPGAVYPTLVPANAVISFDSLDVKLSNFGELELAGSRAVAVYSAPELTAEGPPDPRTAVYSAGAVLYELATGVKPRATGEPPAIPTPGSLVQDFPADVELVILRALSPDPARRFGSARELLSALEGLRTAHGWKDGKARLSALLGEVLPDWRDYRDTLEPEGPNTEPATPVGWRRTARWVAVCAAAALAVAGVGLWRFPNALESVKTALAPPPPPPPPKSKELTEAQKQARMHQQAGLMAEEKGDYARAVVELEQAAALDPSLGAGELLAIARELRDRAQGADAGATPPPRSAP